MTYTIGDKRISLESELTKSESQLILSHTKLFKYCLNSAAYKFLINLKKIIHLYGDIFTIYSTLLRKIPNYDDITLMTNKTKMLLWKLEEDFNELFGSPINGDKHNWEDRHYERSTKKISILCMDSAIEMFEVITKNLNCIDIFFNNFNNLKKLLIPFLLSQTKSIQKSLSKALYLFKLNTISDELGNITELTPSILKQLKKIEKITSGIERESVILNTAFLTFDPSLQQYTSILLGKAILKTEIAESSCQIIKRREVCFQAADHVVSIPLTEEQTANLSMKYLSKYAAYVMLIVFVVASLMVYRLFKMLFV